VTNLLRHAQAHSKFWRERMPSRMINHEVMKHLPVLTREDIASQVNREGSLATTDGAAPMTYSSTGSTGTPVKVYITPQNSYYNKVRYIAQFFITDLTFCDRGILAIFLLGAWPLYVLNVDPWWKWMGLWALVIIQFLLAGAEAAFSFRHDVKPRARSEPPDGLALAGYWRDD